MSLPATTPFTDVLTAILFSLKSAKVSGKGDCVFLDNFSVSGDDVNQCKFVGVTAIPFMSGTAFCWSEYEAEARNHLSARKEFEELKRQNPYGNSNSGN